MRDYLTICKNITNLHYKFGNEIYEFAREYAVSGEPIVRNLEYEYSGKGYEEIKDQFLL